ncbi:unnamed protein product [Clavelina lepadiformis]|uniref:Hydantoinase B/oxoprolinase domain-containing protein n=1 Tax=Clavelina lepadiformis TaxID=159417 RepID=A0ABP0GBK8_CLALP
MFWIMCFLVSYDAEKFHEVTAFLVLPGEFTSCSRTHNLHGNLADLRALVAANQKGIHLVQKLISRSATFDFEGTSPMMINKLNAPRAITKSAIIYSLRCMVGYDIPLNQGCLAPIHLQIPKWSILDPDDDAAVVGGNVLTSQRIVDVIMKAFKVCAASQGCMHNTTFGDDSFGYYETVAGGAGAGPTWHGRSGVHTHMTNTRSTDPEIFENRYPVLLKSFQLLPGTGGEGRYRGGDGVFREILFRKNLTLSVLSERRVFQPYGADGKGDSPCTHLQPVCDEIFDNLGR